MRDIKLEIMFEHHNRDFDRVIGKHYTSVDRLINGEDDFSYSDLDIICKRQFTELKDKGGVEIYDGDILKCENAHIWVVNFHRGGFTACAPSCEEELVFLDDYDFEVIGNIHENKDLI